MSRAHIAGAAVKLHGLHWMRGRHLGWHVVMGKFDWGVRYVIIFLYVQFWIRLGTVSYRGKKVRTVDSPAVRSVNKSATHEIASKTSQNMRSVSSSPLVYITKPYELFCVLWYIANTPQLQSSWRCQCEVTVHRKMSALCTAGAMETTHGNSAMMWPFKGTKLFRVL